MLSTHRGQANRSSMRRKNIPTDAMQAATFWGNLNDIPSDC